MTTKKDAVGTNPLSHLIPRGPAPRPALPPAAPPAPTPAAEVVRSAPTPTPAPVAAALAPSTERTHLPIPAPAVVAVPAPPAAAAASAPLATSASAAAAADADEPMLDASGTPMKRCTVRLPVPLLERMTSAIVHTPGMTQGDFVAEAVAAHLATLERERGAAFPVYGKRLRPGRKSW